MEYNDKNRGRIQYPGRRKQIVDASGLRHTKNVTPSDGGDFQRICSKMATGTGKTIVMAMLIAWNILNKVTYPKDGNLWCSTSKDIIEYWAYVQLPK